MELAITSRHRGLRPIKVRAEPAPTKRRRTTVGDTTNTQTSTPRTQRPPWLSRTTVRSEWHALLSVLFDPVMNLVHIFGRTVRRDCVFFPPSESWRQHFRKSEQSRLLRQPPPVRRHDAAVHKPKRPKQKTRPAQSRTGHNGQLLMA